MNRRRRYAALRSASLHGGPASAAQIAATPAEPPARPPPSRHRSISNFLGSR